MRDTSPRVVGVLVGDVLLEAMAHGLPCIGIRVEARFTWNRVVDRMTPFLEAAARGSG